jgi:hypothetical protein
MHSDSLLRSGETAILLVKWVDIDLERAVAHSPDKISPSRESNPEPSNSVGILDNTS